MARRGFEGVPSLAKKKAAVKIIFLRTFHAAAVDS